MCIRTYARVHMSHAGHIYVSDCIMMLRFDVMSTHACRIRRDPVIMNVNCNTCTL